MDLNWDSIKSVMDIGLGGLSLALYARMGKIVKDHEARITALEAKKPRKRR